MHACFPTALSHILPCAFSAMLHHEPLSGHESGQKMVRAEGSVEVVDPGFYFK